MKQIQPVNIWVNGEQKQGISLSIYCSFDDYESEATSDWNIYDNNDISVAQGRLIIKGQDYINWGDQPAMAINEWIYNWVADKLNLTII